MRKLTAVLCLTIAVLLGSAGVSESADFPGLDSYSGCSHGSDGSVSCGGEGQ